MHKSGCGDGVCVLCLWDSSTAVRMTGWVWEFLAKSLFLDKVLTQNIMWGNIVVYKIVRMRMCVRTSIITPVSEVGNMRTNKSKKQLVMNVARIALLAVCFTLMFAFALAQDAFGVTDAWDARGKRETTEKGDGAELGKVTAITGDHGELDAMDFGYSPSSSQSKWTVTETFNNTFVSLSNHHVEKTRGDTKIYTFVDNYDFWNIGIENAVKEGEVYSIINYNPGTFIKNLLRRNDIKVTASFSAQYDRYARGAEVYPEKPHVFYSATKSANGVVARTAKNLSNKKNYDQTGWLNSNTIELDANNPIVGISINLFFSLSDSGPKDRWLQYKDLTLTLTIEMDKSKNIDNATIIDNSAPVVTSQYVSDSSDTYSPYLPTINQSYNGSSWPIWYDSMASQLSRYTDEVTYANGNLSSFTNRSLDTQNGKPVYKKSVVKYTDTYDYSAQGSAQGTEASMGFSASTLERLYTEQINNNKSPEEAAAAVNAILPYMSLGMRKANSVDYAKLDVNNPASSIEWKADTADRFVAGIKEVQVGDPWKDKDNPQGIRGAVINVRTLRANESASSDIYVDGAVVGRVTVTKNNRAEVTVTTYMYTNAKVSTIVKDNGDFSNETSITFSGIDVTAPITSDTINSGVLMDPSDYIALDGKKQSLKWVREQEMSYSGNVDVYEDDASAGYAPYIWFYSVDKANSWAELASIKPKVVVNSISLKNSNMLPIAYGSFNEFAYDFENGFAKGYKSQNFDVPNPSDMAKATGAGYYRFTFYTFDIAGNKGGESTYYVKVDYDTPTYEAKLSYVDENGQTVVIDPSQNGKWATGATTLSLRFPKPNFSGLSIMFEDMNSAYMVILDGTGEPKINANGGNIVKYISATSATDVSGNQFDIQINSELQPITARVKVIRDGDAVALEFFFDDARATVAFVSAFTAYAGQYELTTDPDSDEMALGYVDRTWGSAIKVLIDRINPEKPELSDVGDVQYISPLNWNYNLPTNRVWYTDGYNFNAYVAFTDYLTGSDYASGVRVYTGIKNVDNADELIALQSLNIEGIYKTINEENYRDYFDRLQVLTGDKLDGDQTEITLNLIKEQGASMRVLYAWIVDQAGNCSGINVYYVLADGNYYTVNSTVLYNDLLGNTAKISQTNAEEMTTTAFKRGEQISVNLELGKGYVPFKFTRKNVGLDDVLLLSNYTPRLEWTIANSNFAPFASIDGNYSKIKYTVDDPFSLGDLPSVTTLELAHRQVIVCTLNNRQVSYTSEKLVLPMTLNNDFARPVVEFVYVDEDNNILYENAEGGSTIHRDEAITVDGNPQLFVPVAVGDYKVRVFIRMDNPNFVTSDFQMNSEGNQMFVPVDVSILRGSAVIIAKATRSIYGDSIEGKLEYELQGVAQENLASEGISFKLALGTAKPEGSPYPVGEYNIVAEGLAENYKNYNVRFVSAIHTISRRVINVQTWNASKIYGDKDPEFYFGVGAEQFAGYDMESMLETIFGGFGYEKAGTGKDTLVDGGEQFQLYKAGTRISRMPGEAVGEYKYVPNVALFDINNNFSLTINNTQHFLITQRTVTIDVSGQSSVFPFGADVDVTTIKPSYTLSAEDSMVAEDVASLVADRLYLADTFETGMDAEYSEKRLYAILLATGAENANIVIQLGDNASYIVYIALQNTVTVSMRDGAFIEFGYGVVWDALNTILFDRDKFVVSDNAPAFTNIVWSANIASEKQIPDAGRHIVTVTGAKLIGEDGNEIADTAVRVNTFVITINPAIITVNATIANNQKTYGEEDGLFGINFEIDSIDGQPFASGDTFANLTYDAIYETLSGSYARATYSRIGDLRSIGYRYDNATDNGNFVLGTDGDYYGLAVDKEFSSSNRNFVVEANLDLDQRFIINPKEVVLHTKHFVGINKSYDGTTAVAYNELVKAYDFAKCEEPVLVRAEDKLELVFTAEYGDVGYPEMMKETHIIFSNLALGGDSAINYVLTDLFNDGLHVGVTDAVGSENGPYDPYKIYNNPVVKIHYTDNINGGIANRIKILMAEIGLLKSDIKISKEYDNTNALTIDCIQIADSQTTAVLSQILKSTTNPAVIVEEATSLYSDTVVGNNYNIPIITIFFPINDPDKVPIKTDGDYATSEISIEPGRHQNMDGLRVKLSNMQAEITKRTLGAKSFDTIVAVNRDYNGTPYVDTQFTFKEEALAQGDTASSVDLHLMAQTANGKVEPGEYTVNFAELSASNDNTKTYVGNQNYTIDVDALNVAYELKVTISRAKLLPNVTFVNREYDNSSAVEVVAGEGGSLTTLHYATNLQSELENFTIVGSVTYTLSSNGMPDANVTEDLLHNVLVQGLMIVENGDNNYLRNYELYGERYSNGQYNSVGSVLVDSVIADYELIDIVEIYKREVKIIRNNFIIEDKIYDGTKEAFIDVDVPEEDIVPEHLGKFKIVANGEFARRQVGDNIDVSIDNVQLVALNPEDSALINNYKVTDYRGKHKGNIVPRPIVLEADLGVKEYDGYTDIPKSSIKYTYHGIIPADEASYAVQTRGGAYYIDSDVEVERDSDGNPIYYADEELTQALFSKENADGEVHYYIDKECTIHAERKFAKVLSKSGTIYDPKLANIKERYTNYVLTQTSTSATDNYIAFKTSDGEMHYYTTAPTDGSVVEYYSPLPSSTKYIRVDRPAAIEKAFANGAIVGYYGLEDKSGYLVKDGYTDEENADAVCEIGREVVYFQATGKIAQRYAYIKSDGIRKTNSETAFTKQYDATKKFFGKISREGADGDGDFYYVPGSISNIIDGDEVEIEDVFAEFDSAETNAMYVIFTVSGIKGPDAYKYTSGGVSAVTRLRAKIEKRTIDAYLADGEMVYGTNPSNVGGDISYRLNGKDITWVEEERAFFMNYKEYLVALGFITNETDEVKEEDWNYLANSRERTYNKNTETGAYEKAPEGTVGEYIKFRGTFGQLPRATATFRMSTKPNVGDHSLTYRLVGGDASNFVFAYNYTQTGGSTSDLVVVKKDLYVAIQGSVITKVYGEPDKIIELQYLDKNGNKGIVSGDTVTAIFRDGNVDFKPVAYLAIYNVLTGECTAVDQYAKISADLGENEYYVYCLRTPDGVNYNDCIQNYNIILGTITHTFVKDDFGNDVVDASGKKLIQPAFEYAASSIKPVTSQLTIVLPELTTISIKSENSTFVYEEDGIKNVKKALYGVDDFDRVSFFKKNADGSVTEINATNVGHYVGYVKVERFIYIDENDENGYSIVWTSDKEISITIEKADVMPKADPVLSTYTGKEQKYVIDGDLNNFSYQYIQIKQPSMEFDVKIEKLVGGQYVEAKLIDAGIYRLTFTPNDYFFASHENYTASPCYTTYTITRAVVNIDLDKQGFTVGTSSGGGIQLSSVYDANVNYDLDYTVTMSGDTNDEVRIDKDKTDLILSKSITQPGKYSFDVQIIDDAYNKDNYEIIGGYGIIELSTPVLTNNKGGVEIEGTGVVANRLEVREITEGSGTAGDSALFETVKSYMPLLSEQANLDYTAEVVSVLDLKLYCDGVEVSLDGKQTKVRVALPENINKMDGIAVYMRTEQGTLKRLTNYSIVDGNIEYTTDYLGSLVFVDLNGQGIASWIIILIVVVTAVLAIAVIATLIAYAVKKSKLKKLM